MQGVREATVKKRKRAALLLGAFEGPSTMELVDVSPCGLLLVDVQTREQEAAIEAEERRVQWSWQDELARRVREGEVSIESAIRAAGEYAGKLQRSSCARADRRWKRDLENLRSSERK